jgi:ribonuclease P/MRP protein subunit RPP1
MMYHCPITKNYDVISLDLSAKLPFMLKRNPVYEALRKGKYFEIQYSCLFEEGNRVAAMTNMINLIKATNGKNIIVSSSAENLTQHRTPYDVACLLASLGMDKNKALGTMKENAENVMKSALHRKFFKSAIQEIPPQVVDRLSRRIKKHKSTLKSLLEKKKEPEEKEGQLSTSK